MNEGTLDTLDLTKNLLFGFERNVYDTIIYSIYRGIVQGKPIDPVPVACKDGRYYLTFLADPLLKQIFLQDGGHHRAYTHFKMGVPLPVLVMPEKYAPSFGWHVSTFTIEEDFRNTSYEDGICVGKKYEPLDGFKRPLDIEKLAEEFRCKTQMH